MRISRRTFLGAAAAAAALPFPSLAAPNERLRLAVIGLRGRGKYLVTTFLKVPGVEIAALCDVTPEFTAERADAIEKAGGRKPAFFADARKLYEDKSIDAVVIATPNHTHAWLTVLALQAGKHVYVEKPLSHTVWEGRKVVEAQKKYGKVVSQGSQSRSMTDLGEAVAYVRSGALGAVKVARGFCYKPRKSLGTKPDAPPPAGLDYDLWLGPAPLRPFNPLRYHYNWHWFWDYGNGDIGNQGAHEMDRCRWALGRETLPLSVTAAGGRLGYKDDGETANTQISVLDYGDAKIVFEVRGLDTPGYVAIPGKTEPVLIGNVIECEKGVLILPTKENPVYRAHALDGEVLKEFKGGAPDLHLFNFADAVKAGKPEAVTCPPSEGHVSSALSHLSNISTRLGEPLPLEASGAFEGDAAGAEAFARMGDHLLKNGLKPGDAVSRGRTLKIDPAAETIVGDPRASAMLTREYRKGYEVPDTV